MALSALTQFSETLVDAPALTNVATNLDLLCQYTLGKATSATPATKPLLKVAQTSTVSLSNNTQTVLSWPTPLLNTDGMWTSGSPTLCTIQTAGWYRVDLQVCFASGGATLRQCSIFVNGTTDPTNLAARHDEWMGSPDTLRIQCSLYDHFQVGDVIRGAALQANGGSLSTQVVYSGVNMTVAWDAPY